MRPRGPESWSRPEARRRADQRRPGRVHALVGVALFHGRGSRLTGVPRHLRVDDCARRSHVRDRHDDDAVVLGDVAVDEEQRARWSDEERYPSQRPCSAGPERGKAQSGSRLARTRAVVSSRRLCVWMIRSDPRPLSSPRQREPRKGLQVVEWDRRAGAGLEPAQLRSLPRPLDPIEHGHDACDIGIGVVDGRGEQRASQGSLVDVHSSGETGELGGMRFVKRDVEALRVHLARVCDPTRFV